MDSPGHEGDNGTMFHGAGHVQKARRPLLRLISINSLFSVDFHSRQRPPCFLKKPGPMKHCPVVPLMPGRIHRQTFGQFSDASSSARPDFANSGFHARSLARLFSWGPGTGPWPARDRGPWPAKGLGTQGPKDLGALDPGDSTGPGSWDPRGPGPH